MKPEQEQFLKLYLKARHEHQETYYSGRAEEYESAHNQAVLVTTILTMLALVVSVLAASHVADLQAYWGIAAVIFPALATAFIAYDGMYAFERQNKLFNDSAEALGAAYSDNPLNLKNVREEEYPTIISDYVNEVESIFKAEQGQWSQLIRDITDNTSQGG
jgi:predicted O-methyltransferase YrrM